MGFDVDLTHGSDHIWSKLRASVTEAMEALADVDAQWFDPDPKSTSGNSARVLGYSHTASDVIVVILVHRDDRTGPDGGRVDGGPAPRTDERIEKG